MDSRKYLNSPDLKTNPNYPDPLTNPNTPDPEMNPYAPDPETSVAEQFVLPDVVHTLTGHAVRIRRQKLWNNVKIETAVKIQIVIFIEFHVKYTDILQN